MKGEKSKSNWAPCICWDCFGLFWSISLTLRDFRLLTDCQWQWSLCICHQSFVLCWGCGVKSCSVKSSEHLIGCAMSPSLGPLWSVLKSISWLFTWAFVLSLPLFVFCSISCDFCKEKHTRFVVMSKLLSSPENVNGLQNLYALVVVVQVVHVLVSCVLNKGRLVLIVIDSRNLAYSRRITWRVVVTSLSFMS